MKAIVYSLGGQRYVTCPVINTFPVREEITEEQAFQRAFAKLPPGALVIATPDVADIPKERAARDAWKAAL